MKVPEILSNSPRTDRLLKSKLNILRKTLRIRGVEVQVIKGTNEIYRKVHSVNDIDLYGDRFDENSTMSVRLVLNLNTLDRVGEKANSNQTCYHIDDIANEGDIILYRSKIYEYAFKISRKSVYGEEDFIYEYELDHFRTIKINDKKDNEVTYYSKEIDKYFETHENIDPNPTVNNKPDWRDRIKDLDII